jgi:hypothetical protein
MGDVFLNGRRPVPWELPALQRARECELERDMRVLAGLLTGERVPHPEASPRPVTDLSLAHT